MIRKVKYRPAYNMAGALSSEPSLHLECRLRALESVHNGPHRMHDDAALPRLTANPAMLSVAKCARQREDGITLLRGLLEVSDGEKNRRMFNLRF